MARDTKELNFNESSPEPDIRDSINSVEIDSLKKPKQPNNINKTETGENFILENKGKVSQRAERLGVTPTFGAEPSLLYKGEGDQTISKTTISQYLHRGNLLLKRFQKETGISHINPKDINPSDFVNWTLTLKSTIKSSTWRMYRSSIYYFLQGFSSIMDIDKAISMLDMDINESIKSGQERNQEHAPKTRKTSALKEKRFPEEDFERVISYLRTACRGKLATVVSEWLQSGIKTGLRPAEWRATELERQNGRVFLFVLNAKASNGRGTNVVRILDITSFDDESIDMIERMSQRGKAWLENGQYNEIQGRCSTLLYSVTGRLWPSRKYHYSLYSTRHQAIANWKSILEPAEIAALVGHAVTETASTHYGRRRSSWGPDKIPTPPRPMPEDIDLIKERVRVVEQRKIRTMAPRPVK